MFFGETLEDGLRYPNGVPDLVKKRPCVGRQKGIMIWPERGKGGDSGKGEGQRYSNK